MHGLPHRRGLAACLLCLAPTAALAIGRYDARNGDECRAQVESNFRAISRDMAAHGNYHGIASRYERWYLPALEECAQMDQADRTQRIRKANERLEAAIQVLRGGGALDSEVTRAIGQEHAAIAAFPHSPYRDAHLALYTEYQRYASLPPASAARCPQILRALKSARAEHDAAVDALLRHEPDWRVHDQVRQAAIAEMRFQAFDAERAGCATR